MNNEKGNKKLIAAIWSLAVSLLVLMFIIHVLLFMSKGWMSKRTWVEGKTGGVNVTEIANIEVRKVSNGDDIDEIRARSDNDTDDDLPLVASSAKLRPGSNGSFTAYIVNDPLTLQGRYTIDLKLYANGLVDMSEERYANMSQAERDVLLEEALKYVNTHIAFFCSYDSISKEYSGWIPANTQFHYPQIFTEPDNEPDKEYPVTIYWVWVEYYSDIGDNGVGPSNTRPYLISPSDRVSMYNNMNIKSTDWLYGSTERRSVGYNNADMYLANILSDINFEMQIVPN